MLWLWRNFSGITGPKAEKLENLTVEIAITPVQAAPGGNFRVYVPARAQCPTCRGHGGVGFYDCWRCAGEGEISGKFPVLIQLPPGIPDNHAVQIGRIPD